jgi:hypothetical protein
MDGEDAALDSIVHQIGEVVNAIYVLVEYLMGVWNRPGSGLLGTSHKKSIIGGKDESTSSAYLNDWANAPA